MIFTAYRWTIKARITSKSEKRHWSNAKGEGTLFSIDLLDSTGGEIRATFFKEACEKFYPILEESKVYTFSGGQVKVGNSRQYSQIKNQYELTFSISSEIHAVSDDRDIKAQHYSFIKIDALNLAEVGAVVDIIAIVRSATDANEIQSSKLGGKTLVKRDLNLLDDTNCEIKLTLWGDKAQAPYDWHTSPIVAFRNLKLGDYGGRSLSSLNTTSIQINPAISEGVQLYEWMSKFSGQLPAATSLSSGGGGAGGGVEGLEKRKLISCIRDEGLGANELKPDFVTIKGTIIYMKHDNDPWYTACPTPGCNKKVTQGMNSWTCDKCSLDFPNVRLEYSIDAW
jgi:replication factor A1